MRTTFWRTLANLKADGYSYASMNISSRLQDLGLVDREDISFDGQEIVKTLSISPEGQISFIRDPYNSDIIINNCLPHDYSFDGKYVIGFTYWETTVLPPSWVEQMNKCDEIWTASSWARDVFISSGVTKPVYAFNLGIDSAIFKYKERKNSIPFTFIHVGSPSTRKNTQLAVDAFIELFGTSENYRLIIKSNGPPDARRFVGGSNLGGLYGINNIKIIDNYLTDSELANLFWQCHCMIYPTRGEGWGMAPFQSIATGLPTICTNRTACGEFAGLSVPLEAGMSRANQFGIYEVGEWAEPKLADVCDRILYVINNYDEILEKTRHGSDYIHNTYSWDNIVKDYALRLKEIQI